MNLERKAYNYKSFEEMQQDISNKNETDIDKVLAAKMAKVVIERDIVGSNYLKIEKCLMAVEKR